MNSRRSTSHSFIHLRHGTKLIKSWRQYGQEFFMLHELGAFSFTSLFFYSVNFDKGSVDGNEPLLAGLFGAAGTGHGIWHLGNRSYTNYIAKAFITYHLRTKNPRTGEPEQTFSLQSISKCPNAGYHHTIHSSSSPTLCNFFVLLSPPKASSHWEMSCITHNIYH